MRITARLAVFVGLLILISPLRFAAADDATTRPAPAAAGLDLLVLDPDGKPIGGAQITATIDGKASKSVTHPDGHAQIPPPKKATSAFSVAVHVDGLVDKSADWRNRKTDPIPSAYTMRLEAGTTIRGKVVDDAGQGVEGATVVLWISEKSTNTRERYSQNTTVTTSTDGTWSFDGVPSEGATVRAGAWDYHYDNGDFFEIKTPAAAELRDGSFTLSLKRGVEIDCVILKPDGTPLEGAHIAAGSAGAASNKVPPQTTDHDGKAVYFASPGSQVVLTVSAGGYATDMAQFIMGSDKHDVSMKMAASTPITGQVVDPNGKPVPNAWVYPDTWRGFRSLDVRIRADRNGNFIWKDPPADQVLCDVEAGATTGFMRARGIPMTAGDQPIVVTLQRALRVAGTVVDAQTNQPIQSFQIIRGISFDKARPPNWQPGQSQPGHDGEFQFTENFPYPGYAVRIQADGYAAADSRVFTADENAVTLAFKLTKGSASTFTILNPDGKPAAAAKAVLLGPGENLQINDDNLYTQAAQATAGPDGKCSFSAPSGSFKLFVMNATGYAEIKSTDIPKSGEVRLTAWGQVEGKLMHAGKPWAQQKVMVQEVNDGPYNPSEARVFRQMQTTTDASGAFTVDRVPAGKVLVGREVETGNGRFRTMTINDDQTIDVSAGQTIEVSLGNQGRPVDGRVVVPPSLAQHRDGSWMLTGWARTMPNRVPMPADIVNGTDEQRASWYKTFLATDAGKAFFAAQQSQAQRFRNYLVEVTSDGKFHLEEVVAGSYIVEFSIEPLNSNAPPEMRDENALASGTAEFTVAEIPGGYTDEPQVLPDVQMTLLPHVSVGDVAPDFTAKGIDGNDMKLSDFKGKFVLLDFFTTRMRGEDNDVKSLVAASDAFGSDDRFVMFGVNVNGSPDDIKSYTQKNGLSWKGASLTDSSASSPMQTYPIRQMPSIMLIGPDGKVIAKGLRGDAIKAALTKALGPEGF